MTCAPPCPLTEESADPDLAILRGALSRLDRAPDFEAAQTALEAFAAALGMPVLSWAPDVSRPAFDAWMHRFMRRQGWTEQVLQHWWNRSVMLKSPLYIRCRTRALPFVTDMARGVTDLVPAARAVHRSLAQMGLSSMITVPVHLPMGQVAQLSFGGPLSPHEAEARLGAARAEIMAAAHFFQHAFAVTVGPLPGQEEARSNLTPKEWESLRLTAQGHREAAVAALMGIRPSTVRYHLRNVAVKLDATTRTHAVAKAAQLGLLGPIS